MTADLRALRHAAGLTQREAGSLCHRTLRGWQDAEAGIKSLDPAALELLLLKLDQHPTMRLVKKSRRQP